MSNIIDPKKSENINVQKYQFGKLDINEQQVNTFNSELFKDTIADEEKIQTKQKEPISPPTELLEKIEALTSQVVTLQMEQQEQKKNFEKELKAGKLSRFEDGKNEGIKETQEIFADENDDLKNQLIRSITLLDEQKNHLDGVFKNIEEDLVESAILIAKKVIKKEIEMDSVKVTKSIASALIDTLKSVGKLTLKVNPNDFKEISEHFNQDSIKIQKDEAISRGGVVILSDSANIDGTISSRLNKAIELIGKE